MSDEIRERIKLARSYCDEGMGSDASRMVISDLADDLDTLLDRPVSQDAQEVAQRLVDKWIVESRLLDQAFITMRDRRALVENIATALQSHADAARLAERERIQIAVESLEERIDPDEEPHSQEITRICNSLLGRVFSMVSL